MVRISIRYRRGAHVGLFAIDPTTGYRQCIFHLAMHLDLLHIYYNRYPRNATETAHHVVLVVR